MAEVKYLNENGLSTVWSKVKGIVTPKADKVSGATAGHLAGLNSSGNLTDSGLAASNVAQKDGSYSGMTVGAAEDLVSAESVASEFTSRITGGSTAVGKGGTALLDKIKGRTLVWNQLLANGNFSNDLSGWTNFASTISASGGEVTLTKTESTETGGFLQSTKTGNPSHKYYMSCYVQTDGTEVYLAFHSPSHTMSGNTAVSTTSMAYTRISQIVSPVNATDVLCVRIGVGATPTGVTCKVKNVMLIDLTLLFGAGSEPATPEELEALYPLPYYDYNTGTLISNAATAIETVGWNQWDEEWESGVYAINSGVKVANSQYIRCKNLIPVLPNTTYYKRAGERADDFSLCFYDANGQFINGLQSSVNTEFTTPDNCYYISFYINTGTPATYNNDICISPSDPSRNGTYEPYWRSELELGLGDIKVKSHNLWDEEWENGEIDPNTGINTGHSYVRSKNYIPCEPGKIYRFYKTTGFANIRVFQYDANKQFIGVEARTNVANWDVTTLTNCAYLRFYVWSDTSYGNNICINLSDPAFNGRYEPYGDGGVISITGGLKSAGTVYDEISGGRLVKRIESVDLGTLDTSQVSSYSSAAGVYQFIIPYKKQTTGAGLVANKYGVVSFNSSSYPANPFISNLVYNQSNLILGDDAIKSKNAADVIQILAGTIVYYELATPIEYELAEAIPTAMRNDPYGTERRLPEDTAAIVTAPFRADITYSTNIKEAVQSMPQNYININSMQDFLAALGTLMDGTWTMRPADGKFDFTFTPNPSNE